MGRLGFLAEFSVRRFKENFDRIITDNSLVSERMMLECQINGPGRVSRPSLAINEVAVTAGPPFRLIEVSVSIGGEHLAVCAGDGLVVATPTGSTAYNLSAGGPILATGLQAVVITPLAAHSLSFRPIVVQLEKPITLRSRSHHAASYDSVSAGDETVAVVGIDGRETIAIKADDEVVLSRTPDCFRLLRSPIDSQWHLLNTKLNWGAPPNYEPSEENK